MTIKPIRLFTVSFAVLLAFAIGACEDDSSSDTSNSYTATQSPGDVWSWTLTSSTFTATNDTTGFTYSGGKETLANLFLKLTVNSRRWFTCCNHCADHRADHRAERASRDSR